MTLTLQRMGCLNKEVTSVECTSSKGLPTPKTTETILELQGFKDLEPADVYVGHQKQASNQTRRRANKQTNKTIRYKHNKGHSYQFQNHHCWPGCTVASWWEAALMSDFHPLMVNFSSTATFEMIFFRAAQRLSLWRTHSSFQQHRDRRDECFFQILDTSTRTRPVQKAKGDILSKNNNATLLTLPFGVRADCCLHTHPLVTTHGQHWRRDMFFLLFLFLLESMVTTGAPWV